MTTASTRQPVFPSHLSLDELDRVVTCNHAMPFSRREFAADMINLDNNTSFFKRHMNFDTVADLWRWTTSAQSTTNCRVQALHMGGCRVAGQLRREFVFDFDVTDMKERCACACAERRTACPLCWLYARVAMHCVASMLVDDFGVPPQSLEWYFSGNRGFHCYVTAASLGKFNLHTANNDQRRTLAERFVHVGEGAQRLTIAQKQLLPELRVFYTNHIYPAHCSALGDANAPERLTDRQILALCWPKLDTSVSANGEHLLRAPYSINPKSGHYVTRIPTESIALLDYVPDTLHAAAAAAVE